MISASARRKHPKARTWLARHPRWTFRITPTTRSWFDAVEYFFSALTRERIRRNSFHSIAHLPAAIIRNLAEHDADPNPFVWTASAGSIMGKLDRQPEPSKWVRA